MADDRPEVFLDSVMEELPPATAVPLGFGVLKADPAPPPQLAGAQSHRHRAAGYYCYPFYKSVSRCFKPEE